MFRLDLTALFAVPERIPGRFLAAFVGIISTMFPIACSPAPDPCGPQDTQQAGSCASIRANGGTEIGALTRPPACGDGVRSGYEECDGEDFGGVTCEMLGAGTGTLLCDPITCRFVFFQCNGAVGSDSGAATPQTGGAGGNSTTSHPFCASQSQLPSWDSPIGQRVPTLCGGAGCHIEANSYDGFVTWYNNTNRSSTGVFEIYLNPTHHNPSVPRTEYDLLKCWIALGMPRTQAEISSGD